MLILLLSNSLFTIGDSYYYMVSYDVCYRKVWELSQEYGYYYSYSYGNYKCYIQSTDNQLLYYDNGKILYYFVLFPLVFSILLILFNSYSKYPYILSYTFLLISYVLKPITNYSVIFLMLFYSFSLSYTALFNLFFSNIFYSIKVVGLILYRSVDSGELTSECSFSNNFLQYFG